jgi:hypothetical protein
MSDTVVYLGPSMPLREARQVLDAKFLPPIRRRDLETLPRGVRFVGIIDGEFFQKLAISPKEILKALGCGVKVFGSSSMGALRAAETHMYGTVGIGRIFEQFRDGNLDADDEVALAYEAITYRALSDPMVNLREGLALAHEAGVISATKHMELLAAMKALYFPLRSWRALEQLCPALRAFANGRSLPDPKRDDALALLLAMRQAREQEILRSRVQRVAGK